MFFKAIDNRLLKKPTKIWKKISILVGKEFDSEPVYDDNDKYMKTKIKSYGSKLNTNLQGKKVNENGLKENPSYKCLSLLMVDSVVEAKKKVRSSNAFGRIQIWNMKVFT